MFLFILNSFFSFFFLFLFIFESNILHPSAVLFSLFSLFDICSRMTGLFSDGIFHFHSPLNFVPFSLVDCFLFFFAFHFLYLVSSFCFSLVKGHFSFSFTHFLFFSFFPILAFFSPFCSFCLFSFSFSYFFSVFFYNHIFFLLFFFLKLLFPSFLTFYFILFIFIHAMTPPCILLVPSSLF